MKLTSEQIKLLGLNLPSGSEVTLDIKLPEIKKWNPAKLEHGYFIETVGLKDIHVQEVSNYDPYYDSEIGNLFPTRDLAKKAIKDIVAYLRISAWLCENDDGWVANWLSMGQEKYSVFLDEIRNCWIVGSVTIRQTPSVVYMSEANALKLCDLANNGIVDIFGNQD
jgi:hypothetical protein